MRFRAALALTVALAVSLPAFAADTPDYAKSSLSLGGRLIGHKSADINGDGLTDIVAACVVDPKEGSKEKPNRFFGVYYQKKDGTYSSGPDVRLDIPADAVVYDTGDVTGTGRESVCFIGPDGVYAFGNGKGGPGGKPKRIIETRSVFTAPDPYDMPCWPMFAPDGKGADVALIPGVGSVGVYVNTGNGYAYSADLETPAETTFEGGPRVGADGTMTVSQRLAEPHFGPYAAKGSNDLILAWDDCADIYSRIPGNGFNQKPVYRLRPGLMKPPKKGPLENAWVAPLDFDGDGLVDFAVTKKTGGVAHARSFIFIYIRGRDGKVPAKPTHTIITEGVVGPRFVDMNGDGRLDVLLPSVKVGVRNFVNILTSGEVGVDIAIYIQKKDGSYGDMPDSETRVTFELDLSSIGRAVPVLETGRFRKPGKGGGGAVYGLAVVSREDEVSVFMPDRYRYIADRPGLTLDVEGPSELTVADLNSDGIDDLVMTYMKSGTLPDKINVFVSK